MEACQFAAASGCQRTQIITLRDRKRPWLFMGLDVWKEKKKNRIVYATLNDFLLVIIQRCYCFVYCEFIFVFRTNKNEHWQSVRYIPNIACSPWVESQLCMTCSRPSHWAAACGPRHNPEEWRVSVHLVVVTSPAVCVLLSHRIRAWIKLSLVREKREKQAALEEENDDHVTVMCAFDSPHLQIIFLCLMEDGADTYCNVLISQ